ncbi:MAG: hypothetical protein JEY94_06905 [Melioribacteraceae bacterium]|nr:hypothetical protein [Melioribacteraceae bacterium]
MKKILYICGSKNQTTMMHKISEHLSKYDNYFTNFYGDGIIKYAAENDYLNFTILGNNFKESTFNYLRKNNLQIDPRGGNNDYDLIFTCSDLIIPNNLKNKKVILVQEGMTDPENFMYYMAKYFKFPRYLASTSTTGLSDAYTYFCVASEGYNKLFLKKGIRPEKLLVTGIPNFDNLQTLLNNNFPHKDFVLVATSDARETLKYENRKKFIKEALKIAGKQQLIFKLHPNENFRRATKEINELAPEALVYTNGSIDEMIANCTTLITKYSTVVYVGIVLNKEVYSYFDLETLKSLQPIQNNGESAGNIAKVAEAVLTKLEQTEFYFNEWALNNGY